jgi:hypothetical protein
MVPGQENITTTSRYLNSTPLALEQAMAEFDRHREQNSRKVPADAKTPGHASGEALRQVVDGIHLRW